MTDLQWSWLAAPYVVCALAIGAVALAGALVRGDRVLRIGLVGAAVTALPWATSQALAACTRDPVVATHMLRLGQGSVALTGPTLLLLLLGMSGQLERHKWIVRVAGLIGGFFMIATWTTRWTVPGVQLTRSGMYYVSPGPLTALQLSLIVVCLAIGIVILQRASPRGERRRTLRLMIGVFACSAIGSADTLLLYGIWGVYPIAWLPATLAAAIALYVVLRTDALRPQGLDRGMVLELIGFAAATAVTAAVTAGLHASDVAVQATLSAFAWTLLTAIAWAIARSRPVRIASDRALDEFVTRVATLEDETQIAAQTAALWRSASGIAVTATWWMVEGDLVAVGGAARWPLETDVIGWLIDHGDALAIGDLATMRLGELRPKLEALGAAHGAGLIVPLVDRGELVGVIEARFDQALREGERGLVVESARAAARALTYAGLARTAARELTTAREVEIATALRLQATARGDAEFGRWVIAVEYSAAEPTTGAGWSAAELADGRLALLVTEAQAHGVAAALATAALTGAFAAATMGAVSLDDLLLSLRASSEGVVRGGEPVAAFVAVLDAEAQTISWACARHPGALVVGPVAPFDASIAVGSATSARPTSTQLGWGARAASASASLDVATRGVTPLLPDAMLVVASTELRGDDDDRWEKQVRGHTPSASRVATILVEAKLRDGAPAEDLLVVVVRSR